MTHTVGDYLFERLHEWGIKRIFGFPGDGINGIMGALGRAADRFDYVRVRHEEMAAFMAGGHAKFTGEVGVCMATSGPGAIHLLNGLYDAKMDHMPVVAIVGQQARTALGSDYQQEVDLQNLFQDVSGYVEMISSPAQVRHVHRSRPAHRGGRALRDLRDRAERPAGDGCSAEPAACARQRLFRHRLRANAHPAPSQDELQRAAAVLNAGEKVAILVGAGALARGRRGDRAGRSCSVPVWPRRCWARRHCRTTCRSSPDRSACWAPSRAGR